MEAQDVAEMATINTKNYESITRKKHFIWLEQYRKGLYLLPCMDRRVVTGFMPMPSIYPKTATATG